MPSQHYSHCPTRYSYSHSRSRDYSPLHRRSSTETSRSDRSSRDSYSREEDSVKETRRTVHRKRVVYSPIPRRNKSQKLQIRRRKEKDDEPISSRTRSKTAAKRGRKNKTSKDVAKLGSTAPRTRRRKATGSAKKSSSARKSRRTRY
uniref:Uncharacterized protein n=1 Tax=Haemonchus placei TaxID=6290 RepID=A0A0N4WTA3_HAEPC